MGAAAATHLFAATGRREALGADRSSGHRERRHAGRPRSAVAPPLPAVVRHAADRSRPGPHAQRCYRACDRRLTSAVRDDPQRSSSSSPGCQTIDRAGQFDLLGQLAGRTRSLSARMSSRCSCTSSSVGASPETQPRVTPTTTRANRPPRAGKLSGVSCPARSSRTAVGADLRRQFAERPEWPDGTSQQDESWWEDWARWMADRGRATRQRATHRQPLRSRPG
jgi:hypothetical protein